MSAEYPENASAKEIMAVPDSPRKIVIGALLEIIRRLEGFGKEEFINEYFRHFHGHKSGNPTAPYRFGYGIIRSVIGDE